MKADLLRERVWAAHPAVFVAAGASGSAHRALFRSGEVVGADLGVPHPWGVQITAGDLLPDDRDAAAGLAWCRRRGGQRMWRVSVPERLVGKGPWRELREQDSVGLFAAPAEAASHLAVEPPADVHLDVEPSYSDVISGYGGWMSDPPLARQLVTSHDLTRSDRGFVVARIDGRPVGCALVWWAGGTGVLSGIGVVADQRGRGVGRALTGAAARMAACGSRAGRHRWGDVRPDVVWMAATEQGARLYAQMGFRRVDTEVQLGPPASSKTGVMGR